MWMSWLHSVATYAAIGSFAIVTCSSALLFALGWSTLDFKQRRLNTGPLGLSKRRRKLRAHAILPVERLQHWHDWASSLSRSPRTTLLKQLDKTWAAKDIHVATVTSAALGLKHLAIVVSHQRRSQPVFGIFIGWFRFLVARMMSGSVDVYYCNNVPIAFCQYICKGNTLRAMWFYTNDARSLLWFGALRAGVQRAIETPGVAWLDAGPSKGDVAQLKQRYGFEDTEHWRTQCDYDGAYREVLPYAELTIWKSRL
jgi:hypothetical protein